VKDMADFVKFICDVATDTKIGKELIENLDKMDAKALEEWFKKKKYDGVSLAECKMIIKNKKKIIATGQPKLRDNY
jgi:hypothetical protein